MKKIFASLIVTLMIIGISGITSCQNRAEKERKILDNERKSEIKEEIPKNVYPLPTSAEVIRLLTELEVGYMVGIANPVENVKKYFQSTRKAINMGVYGADLSYATLYNMNQEVINYLSAIRSLSNELNMSKIYDEALYDNIKANFDNRDKLVDILQDAFNRTYGYLSEDDQQDLALLVVGGAWVEGMYLTTHVSEAAYQVAGIAGVLLEQKKSFDRYIEITAPFLSDPVVGDFVKLLEPMKKVYEGMSTSLSEQNIKDITVAITGIRNQIVQ
jgi:hypothetical protein